LISQAATDHGKQKKGGQKNGAENVIFLPAFFSAEAFVCPAQALR
jgi:hypothetical protein